MITLEEKKCIKATFGMHYTQPILDYLNLKKIYNQHDKPFSQQSIRNVVTMVRSHQAMEKAIIELLVLKGTHPPSRSQL